MPESQEDIDALLAEVSALADEAVADIGGDDLSPASQELSEPSVAEQVGSSPSPVAADHDARSDQDAVNVKSRRQAVCDRILHIEVPVIVRLAETTMPLSKILNLSTGAIIEFEKPSDSELNLMINNKCIGIGMAVKVGENFGLRVTHIGSLHERIRALGDR